ncbi:hypothetical protein A9Q74_06690 [Colwellia sp. 39_35_sub15_T18]|nr:hypothetical protein A9Q74_06690 [Colwellia sp. 39_35_sub15_T18]
MLEHDLLFEMQLLFLLTALILTKLFYLELAFSFMIIIFNVNYVPFFSTLFPLFNDSNGNLQIKQINKFYGQLFKFQIVKGE